LKLRDVLERFLLTALTFLLFTFFKDRLGLIRPEDYLALIGVLVSLYFVIVPSLLWLFGAAKNKFNRLVPKVGILNGYIMDASREHKCVLKATNVSGIIWESALKKELKGVRLKRIKRLYVDKIDNSFALIVNPYGENYPESDTDLRTTFQRIRAYMSNGGIFFTSGAPFWHHQNTATETNGHWSVVRTTNGFQNMTDGLCYRSLGISVTMPENEPLEVNVYQRSNDQEIVGDLLKGPTRLSRWRAVLPQTPDCLPLIRENGEASNPLCLIQYDKGFLLHSGLWVADESSTEFQILIQALKELISRKFEQLKP
jgi:hypothetical protein